MIARNGQPAYDRFRFLRRRAHTVGRDRKPNDRRRRLARFFGVDGPTVNRNAGPSAVAVQRIGAEPFYDVSDAVVVGVAECDDEATGMRGSFVVLSAPRVHIDVAVGIHRNVSGVADGVGENRRTKAGGKREAAIIPGARSTGGHGRGCRSSRVAAGISTFRFRARRERD